MERDFMGLTVKQETPDETIGAAPVRSSAMQWSFSNIGSSAAPQLLSFQGSPEEKPKSGFDSLTSTRLVTLTTSEAPKNIVHEKQGGVRYTMTTYPTSVRRSITNQANLAISPAVTASGHQSFVAASGQHLTNPAPAVPSSGPVVGTTDLRNTSKIPGAPAQLTIFYNGSVCVYDNISPEKAQAIMLLAGNWPTPNPSGTPSAAPVQASVPTPSVLDGFVVSQPYGTTPHRPSPVPISAPPQSAGRTGTVNDTKPAGVVASSSNIAERQRAANSLGSVSADFLSSDTVPQFRRKSLARFLEKRKERVISASPYGDKQSPDCSSPVPATN